MLPRTPRPWTKTSRSLWKPRFARSMHGMRLGARSVVKHGPALNFVGHGQIGHSCSKCIAIDSRLGQAMLSLCQEVARPLPTHPLELSPSLPPQDVAQRKCCRISPTLYGHFRLHRVCTVGSTLSNRVPDADWLMSAESILKQSASAGKS